MEGIFGFHELGTPRSKDEIRETNIMNAKKMKKKIIRTAIAFLILLVLVGVIIAIVVATKPKNSSNSNVSTSSSNDQLLKILNAFKEIGISQAKKPPQPSVVGGDTMKNCPLVPPSKRLVMFWQTEEEPKCSEIPDGTTHVVWSFALVGNRTNTIVTKFQHYWDEIKQCVKILQSRCIYSLASIGGATNVYNISTVSDGKTLAASALELIKEYDLNGVDIDDETMHEEYNPERIESYMHDLYIALKTAGNNYIISFDGLPFEANDDCETFGRCYPNKITPYIDWINIMAYNFNEEPNAAVMEYYKLIHTTFPSWSARVGPDKVCIGVCVGKACAFGPGPSLENLQDWAGFSLTHGGMMIYPGSGDVQQDFNITKTVLKLVKDAQKPT